MYCISDAISIVESYRICLVFIRLCQKVRVDRIFTSYFLSCSLSKYTITMLKSANVNDLLVPWQMYAIIVGYIVSGLLGISKTTRSSFCFLLMGFIQLCLACIVYYADVFKYDLWIKV